MAENLKRPNATTTERWRADVFPQSGDTENPSRWRLRDTSAVIDGNGDETGCSCVAYRVRVLRGNSIKRDYNFHIDGSRHRNTARRGRGSVVFRLAERVW